MQNDAHDPPTRPGRLQVRPSRGRRLGTVRPLPAFGSGVFYIGRGDRFDEEKLEAYPPGSIVVLPGDTPHFHWAKSGEYVTQVTAIGRPISLTYLNPEDDPRH
jgi:hypothetical protein